MNTPPSFSLFFFFFFFFLLLAAPARADLFSLVYKGCASGSSGAVTPASISALSSALLPSASSARFQKASAGGLAGLFQCRGDLSPADCSACVGRIPSMWVSLCGASSAAARVQLAGCYALYQVSGFPQSSGVKMLYKSCSPSTSPAGSGFDERRGTALAALQSGVASSSSGFYATGYASVYAMAQCEGDLSAADCGECVAEAVQKAQVECGGSSAAQMYLERCYITYSYYPHGVPHGDAGGGGGGGSGQPTGKTVAIVVGAAAWFGFLVICLLFVRSLYKKDDY